MTTDGTATVRLPARPHYFGGLLLGTAGVTALGGFLGIVASGAEGHYPLLFLVALGTTGGLLMLGGTLLIRRAWRLGRARDY